MKNLKISIVIVAFVFLQSCNKTDRNAYVNLKGNVFGTTYSISYKGAKDFQKEIDSLFYGVNKSVSTYIPSSEISKINKGDSTVVVSAVFKEVFNKSKQIYKETDGYFDPTVGNLVNAWGFGPKKGTNELDSLEVKKQMNFVGLHKVVLIKNIIVKQNKEIYLDFNSIAKGFGVDVIGRFLESKQIENYLVEIGGELRVRGKNTKNKFWSVAIEKPIAEAGRNIQKVISLNNKAMATSGNYRKFRIAKNGQKYVHTVNPKTGFANESNLLSVSVIGSVDCANLDAYATAFMAMGLNKTINFVEEHVELQVIVLYGDKNGQIQELEINKK